MKKFLKRFLLTVLALVLVSVLGFLGVLFLRPTLLVNPGTLKFALEKSGVLKKFSWDDAHFIHRWEKWNQRVFAGHFKNFCLTYDGPAASLDACLEEVSWNFNILFDLEAGLRSRTIDPFKVRSSKFDLALKDLPEKKKPEGPPLKLWDYWEMAWSDLVPDLYLRFKDIRLSHKKKDYEFDLSAYKTPKTLRASMLGFDLYSTFEKLELTAPKKYPFPKDLKTAKPLYLRDVKLTADMRESGIPVTVTGFLESISFRIKSNVALPLADDLTSVAFLRKTVLATTASVRLPEVRRNLLEYGPKPYNKLPAPLSNMDGDITLDVHSEKAMDSKVVVVKGLLNVDLKSPKQFFVMALDAEAPVDLETKEPGAVSVEIDFKKVALQLPRLSKKALPPQFFPDKRIQDGPFDPTAKEPVEEKKLDLSFNPQALGKKVFQLKTNLLDEVLRLNFDLFVNEGEVKRGFVSMLPLKTTVFKRPVRVKELHVKFNHPLEPVINATVLFPLPEYKITLTLEGPLSGPKHSFVSDPPLPQNDIYAVLLFGRPMADLEADDKTAASRTNKILSQGILSLSVLYFFAGSSIEYVGFDPDSQNATAQIGLGGKNSLRIGGNEQGVNSTAVRRSLGKGWYLDTSVQNNSSSGNKNYGVLLERIIAY